MSTTRIVLNGSNPTYLEWLRGFIPTISGDLKIYTSSNSGGKKCIDQLIKVCKPGLSYSFHSIEESLSNENVITPPNDITEFIPQEHLKCIYNINSQLPVLLVVDEVLISIPDCEFLCFLPVLVSKTNIQQVLAMIQPKAIVSIGRATNALSAKIHYIPFEYRKKWLHFNSMSEINIPSVEHCIFHSAVGKHKLIKENPIVSVITPAYKSKHRIFRPFYSLLNQTYTNFEWIIISDSPEDEVEWKQLTEFADSDYRIQCYRRPHNDGSIGKNKLFCGNLARGRFVFELDHDDDILPSTFDTLIRAATKHPNAGFFYSDFIECTENSYEPFSYGDYFGLGFGSYYRQYHYNKFQYVCKTPRINPVTVGHIVGVPNHFRCWSKEAYHDVGGHSVDLPVVDDYELILRTIVKYGWCHIPEMLYVQYRNAGGDNFTFHRNQLIQYLVRHLYFTYAEDLKSRMCELGCNTELYPHLSHPKDWEVDHFEYPVLENVFNSSDREGGLCFSIVIPVLSTDSQNALDGTLQNIFEQTWGNFEIYVIGGNVQWLDGFVDSKKQEYTKDKRFRYFNLGTDSVKLCKNYAVKMLVSTKWITYAYPGETWDKDYLKEIHSFISTREDVEYVITSNGDFHTFDCVVKHGLYVDDSERSLIEQRELFDTLCISYYSSSSSDTSGGMSSFSSSSSSDSVSSSSSSSSSPSSMSSGSSGSKKNG